MEKVTKPTIDPRVRAKLEERGVDSVRSKLVHMMGVTRLDEEGNAEPLGDSMSASRRDMQEWLREKSAHEFCWVKVGVIAAVIAAVFAFFGVVLSIH
jgi:hypothetical protein